MNDESIKPIVLTREQTQIIFDARADVARLSGDYMRKYEVKDMNAVIAYCKHESMIDSILHGGDYEIKRAVFDVIDDDRISHLKNGRDYKVVERTAVKRDKKTGAETFERVEFVQIVKGYGDASQFSIYQYFRDVYPKDAHDRAAILDKIKERDAAIKAHTAAVKTYDDARAAGRKPATLNKHAGAQLEREHELKTIESEFKQLIGHIGGVDSAISAIRADIDALNAGKHETLQSLYANIATIVRIAMKHAKEMKHRDDLKQIRDRRANMRAIMQKYTN